MKNELKHYGVLGMRWGVRRAKQLEFETKMNEARQDRTNLKIRHLEAKQKAKTNAEYKNSSEYKNIMTEMRQKKIETFIYGKNGSIKIDALKKQGKTQQQAMVKTKVDQMFEKTLKNVSISTGMYQGR